MPWPEHSRPFELGHDGDAQRGPVDPAAQRHSPWTQVPVAPQPPTHARSEQSAPAHPASHEHVKSLAHAPCPEHGTPLAQSGLSSAPATKMVGSADASSGGPLEIALTHGRSSVPGQTFSVHAGPPQPEAVSYTHLTLPTTPYV